MTTTTNQSQTGGQPFSRLIASPVGHDVVSNEFRFCGVGHGVKSAGKNEVRYAVGLAEKASLSVTTRYYADKGGDGRTSRETLKVLGLKDEDGIMKRVVACRAQAGGKQLSIWQCFHNKLLVRQRSSIERLFEALERIYGWVQSRYVGYGASHESLFNGLKISNFGNHLYFA